VLSNQAELGIGLTPQVIFLFNCKQFYMWLLALLQLMRTTFAAQARNLLLGVLQLSYLLAFMMVLHCFKSGVFTFSVFGAGSNQRTIACCRLLCQASLIAGLTAFAAATFRSQGGSNMDNESADYATMAAYLLLSPELLADAFMFCTAAVSAQDQLVAKIRLGGEKHVQNVVGNTLALTAATGASGSVRETSMRTGNVLKYHVGQFVSNMGVSSASGHIVSLVADSGTAGPGSITIRQHAHQPAGDVGMNTSNVLKYHVGQFVSSMGMSSVSGHIVSLVADSGTAGPGRITIRPGEHSALVSAHESLSAPLLSAGGSGNGTKASEEDLRLQRNGFIAYVVFILAILAPVGARNLSEVSLSFPRPAPYPAS
jgi:hypothetical protein